MKELIIKIYGLNYNELILLIFSLAIISFLFFTFIVIMFEKKIPFKTPYNFLVTASAFSLLPFIFMLCIKAFIELFGFSLKTLDEKWLNFLGSYIGVCGAIGCVWWQLERQRKEKEKENQSKEKKAVATFLILYRETCKNLFYYYTNYLGNLSEEIWTKKFIDIKVDNDEFKINEALFNSIILEMDIEVKNRAIELYNMFLVFSINNKRLLFHINDSKNFLISFYYEFYKKTNDILKNLKTDESYKELSFNITKLLKEMKDYYEERKIKVPISNNL